MLRQQVTARRFRCRVFQSRPSAGVRSQAAAAVGTGVVAGVGSPRASLGIEVLKRRSGVQVRLAVDSVLASFPRTAFSAASHVALDLRQPRVLVLGSERWLRHGAPWVLCLDLERGIAEDGSLELLRTCIEELVQSRLLLAVIVKPSASSLSCAVRPSAKSRSSPKDLTTFPQASSARLPPTIFESLDFAHHSPRLFARPFLLC